MSERRGYHAKVGATVGAWQPQPGLAWATCTEVVDGRFCGQPAAGFKMVYGTGSQIVGVTKCEKHGRGGSHD